MAEVDVNDVVEGISKQIKLSEDSLVPWLMLPAKEGSDLRSFFSLSKGIMSRQVNLPDVNGNKCYSSKGWLLVINKDCSMFLLHPFSNLRVELPHINTFQNWERLSTIDNQIGFIRKYVLSIGPSSVSDYTLMIIYGGTSKLAYFRPGFKTWITIDSCKSSYVDIMYYKEQFYVINVHGEILALDINSDNMVVVHQVANSPRELCIFKRYLVESAGKLLVVSRNSRSTHRRRGQRFTYGTHTFQVFELDWSKNTWTEVNNLGNRSLFLGDNSSLSVEVSDVSICKPNSIYFTDDCQELYYFDEVNGGGKDMGIYNLQDGSIEPFFKGSNIYDHITPPMWV